MSLDAMRWAFQQTALRSPVKFVLVVLADRANERDECWPSRESICADTGLNKQTVSKATEELVSLGLIEKRRTFSGATVYHLVGVPSRHQLAEIPAELKNRTSVSRKTVRQSAEISAPNLPMNLPLNRKKPAKAYAFTGETVRITTDDFQRLAAQYPNLDLAAELAQLDLELRGKRSWWNPLNSKLNYRNKNHVSNRPGRDPSADRSAAGRVRANIARDRAARAGGNGVAVDEFDVRPPVDISLRR